MAVDPSGLVSLPKLAFGVVDFTLSTGEAMGGIGVAIASTAGGPLAPAGFYVGMGVAAHGLLGMANAGIAVQNALYETKAPGILEGIGVVVFGDAGAKVGAAGDLFLGLRPALIASGGLNTLHDVYDLASGLNTMDDAFGTTAPNKRK